MRQAKGVCEMFEGFERVRQFVADHPDATERERNRARVAAKYCPVFVQCAVEDAARRLGYGTEV